MEAVPATTPSLRPHANNVNWLVDEETGFLYPDKTSPHWFSLDKKKEFIATYKANFPNLTLTCEQLGMTRALYYQHLKFDKAFARVIQEIREQKSDQVESALFKVACMEKPAAFMDRIAFLRAYRPNLYMEKKLNLTARDLDPSVLDSKTGSLSHVVDTELIGPGPQDPRLVTSSQEDSKNLPDKKIP